MIVGTKFLLILCNSKMKSLQIAGTYLSQRFAHVSCTVCAKSFTCLFTGIQQNIFAFSLLTKNMENGIIKNKGLHYWLWFPSIIACWHESIKSFCCLKQFIDVFRIRAIRYDFCWSISFKWTQFKCLAIIFYE